MEFKPGDYVVWKTNTIFPTDKQYGTVLESNTSLMKVVDEHGCYRFWLKSKCKPAKNQIILKRLGYE